MADARSRVAVGTLGHMKFETPEDLALLLIRTDYSDDAAFRGALAAAAAVYERGDFPRTGVSVHAVESTELRDLSAQQVAAVPRDEDLTCLAVADARTMSDGTVQFIDVDGGDPFRAIPEEVEPVVANLSLANMDFADFADSVDDDGVFRGFH